MGKEAIIVFVKNPQKGRAKTRIAASVGEEVAFDIYNKLLELTRQLLCNVEQDIHIYYSDFIDEEDQWDNSSFHKFVQKGDDLGVRMCNAFEAVLKIYNSVVIIGSDCPYIKKTHIDKAFALLKENDVVLGPSLDGGYYLLGMNALKPSLFEGIAWSSDSVASTTISKAQALGLSISTLEKLSDIDYIEDWENYLSQA